MTTIAYDGKCVSCDKKLSFQDMSFKYEKFVNFKNFVYIYAGDVYQCLKIIKALNNEITEGELNDYFDKLDDDEISCAVLRYCKKTKTCVIYDNKLMPIKVSAPFALGSGSMGAMTVLHAGHSAPEAIWYTSKVDPGTGIGCFTFDGYDMRECDYDEEGPKGLYE
jgi:hypothetical protein